MPDSAVPIHVAALYQFARFDDADAVRHSLASLCCGLGLKGTLLIAPEGLNGTVAGATAAVDELLAHIRELPGCAGIEVKISSAATPPFARLKVRLKREIVTMGQPGLDPLADAGRYVEAADWNAMIDDPDTIVIDTRNDYEVALGSFAGAVNPGTRSFSEFPAWFRAYRSAREQKGELPRVAMFCTGGIRCEKATAFLKAEGVDHVYHLKGGILAYLQATPPEASRWQGECFVFDQRVTVTHDLAPAYRSLCPRCQRLLDGDVCSSCES